MKIINDEINKPENNQASPKQVQLNVNGHKVTLKFSDKPDYTAIDDIKRIMLAGLVKA